MKLLIAIPTVDYLHFEFAQSLSNLLIRLANVYLEVKFLGRTLIYKARDELAWYAINRGFTHVLWLDADMVFDDSLFDELLSSGKDFVTGRYNERREPYLPCQFSKLVPMKRVGDIQEITHIQGTGFGCVLVTTDILNKIMQDNGTCFLPMAGFSEDLAFCVRAYEAGIELWCEPKAVCGHISNTVIYPKGVAN